MKTVIVTGGIGSGKSAVCAMLRERGIPVYDSDSRTKSLYDKYPSLVESLELALGQALKLPDSTLDRKKLAAVIFSDSSAREKVEAVVYPFVLKDFKRWRSRYGKAPFVVLESAVILSKPVFDGIADAVVLVDAPLELRLQRISLRDGSSMDAALERVKAQEEVPRDKVTEVIVNDSSPERLKAETERVFFDKNSYICKLVNTR